MSSTLRPAKPGSSCSNTRVSGAEEPLVTTPCPRSTEWYQSMASAASRSSSGVTAASCQFGLEPGRNLAVARHGHEMDAGKRTGIANCKDQLARGRNTGSAIARHRGDQVGREIERTRPGREALRHCLTRDHHDARVHRNVERDVFAPAQQVVERERNLQKQEIGV